MRTTAFLLLLAAAVVTDGITSDTDDTLPNTTNTLSENLVLSNDTSFNANDTLTDESDGDYEPVVRKKRTFGDIVFRGLADVLGYNVARKPPQAPFPPPLAPVPGIDTPLQAAAPAPAAPAVAAPAPCGAPRAAGPPPCRVQRPPAPKPKAPPPCPKPRAAPKPKPKPRPPPPPPPLPPCAKPRANPTTPSPCAPAPPAPPPPKLQADPNLETISSNFQLNFNFNRKPANVQAGAEAEEEAEAEAELEQAVPIAPIAIEPRAAKLPPSEPRKPRVYVDAFVVRNGVAQKVDALDANQFHPQRASDEDYLAYDEENEQAQYDDYEDAQESRDRSKAVQEFGSAVDQFWQEKKQQRRLQPQKLPPNHYKNVHFGDRELASQVRLQTLQQGRPRQNRIPLPLPALPVLPDSEDDGEATTTTEDPKRPLRPRVLPPTEHNPHEIDTVTVRVPPIYKEKRPKKHRVRPVERDRDSTETDEGAEFDPRKEESESDTEGEDSLLTSHTERPIKRKRRRKQNRKIRSVEESAEYTAGDFDYYGKKLPVSKEEKYYMQLTVPTPTMDPDLARHEAPQEVHGLDDHERLKEDPERLKDDPERSGEEERSDDEYRGDDSGRADSHERADSRERSVKDTERASNKGRADERERTDKLSPNALVHETGYQNNYVHATNVQVDNPHPEVATVKRKKVITGSP